MQKEYIEKIEKRKYQLEQTFNIFFVPITNTVNYLEDKRKASMAVLNLKM